MDAIQKVLVKVGRRDLAQEYYKKVAATSKLSAAQKYIEQCIKLAEEKNEHDISVRLNSATRLIDDIQKLVSSMTTNIKESISTITDTIGI